jgi:uncharacterized protein (TIGR02246 family)
MHATSSDSDVLDLVHRWAGAERDADPDSLDRLLVDDFVAVGPLGFVVTRDQWLDRYRTGALSNASFQLRDPAVRDYGTAAVVVGTQVQETSYQGRDSSGAFRATLVAVRRDDRWLLAAVHLSPVAGPPVGPGGTA